MRFVICTTVIVFALKFCGPCGLFDREENTGVGGQIPLLRTLTQTLDTYGLVRD